MTKNICFGCASPAVQADTEPAKRRAESGCARFKSRAIEPNLSFNQLVKASVAAASTILLLASLSLQEGGAKELIAVKKGVESGANAGSESSAKGSKKVTTIYDFKEKSIDGSEIDFGKYKGDALLIVNTASECGFTPQYKGLEALHKKFADKGLKVLGFPCNQFGHQEPGDSKAIATFCEKNFGVTFQLFEKVDVNGKEANPLFKYLTDAAPGILGSKGIKWNFTKFLVDRKGNVVKRFGPNVEPEKIIPEIETVLK